MNIKEWNKAVSEIKRLAADSVIHLDIGETIVPGEEAKGPSVRILVGHNPQAEIRGNTIQEAVDKFKAYMGRKSCDS